MKQEKWICDIKGCDNEPIHKGFSLQVIFTTEQTEGRGCTPHLSKETLDLCEDCMSKILEGNYVWGEGAQGHNRYYLKIK